MADSTLDSELILIIDKWPGVANPAYTVPTDGFTGATHHNVVAAKYPIGAKIQVYCDGTTGKPGYSTLMYLKVGTQNGDVAIAAKTVCVPDSATVWYELTNDPDSCIQIGGAPVAIALSAITNAYYGWFWVGGVCPEQYVSDLGVNYATEGNVAAGPICPHDLTADAIGFGPIDEAAPTETQIGYALAADAA
jgi:hypothetical protein